MHVSYQHMDFSDLNKRSLEIFRNLVDAYIETGEPVGSRTISRRMEDSLSPATIRNIMADLEDAGLLYAPHTSAGRLPTDAGLQFFIHGLLEIGSISAHDRQQFEAIRHNSADVDQFLEQATRMLSGLSHCAGVVLAPKIDSALKQIEFVPISPGKVLVILITDDNNIENRIIEVHEHISVDTLHQASRYLTAKLSGHPLSRLRTLLHAEVLDEQETLDALTTDVIKHGMDLWSGGGPVRNLIVRGQSKLLENVHAAKDLERIRELFDILEAKEQFVDLVDAAMGAEGVQIFVGAEHELFKLTGCSLIVAPYKNKDSHVVGAIGVIGPTRMNYGKIIPLVDYTSKVVEKLLKLRLQ